MKTKILLIFLCLISNIGMANAKIVTGDCGENGNNCTYSLNTETGILTISGNGKMQDYSQQSYGTPYSHYYSTAPWTDKSITSIIIEEGVTYVGNYSFYGGYQSSPNGDKYPYSQIGKTLQTITIPNSVTSIGGDAFNCCTSLTSVTIGNNLTSIGLRAFANCSSLISVTIPNSVTSIGEYAFSGCTGLTSVTISNSVTRIEYGTFQHCSGLTTITLPNSITSIGEYAFFGCSGLTSVKIPNSVTSMENYVFYRCSILNLVYCELGAPVSITNTVFQESSPTIYVPNCAFPAFSVAPVWKDMTIAPVSVNLAVMNNTGGVVVENCGQMEIEAIPYIGYHFKRWQDGNKENPRKYTLTQSNRNFIAEFEIDKYTITLNCDASQGSITGDKGKYNYDTDHTIEAVPNYGYHFTQWSDGETENPREFTLVQDTTFTALFAPNKYKLTILYDNKYGDVVGEQGTFDYLSEHSIRVNAKYGYHLASWSDGVTDNPRTLVLTKDTTITASFAPNKYKLEVLADATMGAITGEQGEFDYLTEHTVEAVQNTGYLFTGWSDGVTDNPRTIVLTKDTSITALFEHNLYNITVLCNEGQGSVEATGEFHEGGTCTITATPNNGYHFTQWSDGDTNNPRTFTVTKDETFTAEFAIDKSGTCGDNLALTWTYDSDTKKLTISGDGALNSNYTFGIDAPTSVEKLTIAEGVTAIGNSAFANYTTIKEIVFATSVKTLYEQAFYNCANLTSIYCHRDRPCVVYSNTFEGVDKFDCILYVPAASIDMYKAATGWRDFYFIEAISGTTTAIDNSLSVQQNVQKVIRDGQLFILRDGKIYSVQGLEVR